MTRETCTEHKSCRIPANLRRADVELVEAESARGETFIEVRHHGEVLGTMVDRGFVVYATQAWRTRWEAFTGGNIYVADPTDQECAVRAIIESATTGAFHMRMALHFA